MGGEYHCHLCDKLHGVQHFDNAGLVIWFDDDIRHICSTCKHNKNFCRKCGDTKSYDDDHHCNSEM
jgi:hypothetical protein